MVLNDGHAFYFKCKYCGKRAWHVADVKHTKDCPARFDDYSQDTLLSTLMGVKTSMEDVDTNHGLPDCLCCKGTCDCEGGCYHVHNGYEQDPDSSSLSGVKAAQEPHKLQDGKFDSSESDSYSIDLRTHDNPNPDARADFYKWKAEQEARA